MIKQRAFARAGLLGNPSDGFGGKTIAFVIRDFWAEVSLRRSDQLRIIPGEREKLVYDSLASLCYDIRAHGYYGGIRLIKAAARRFADYCHQRFELHQGNFVVEYSSNIPQCVGMAGSSAIVVATLKALLEFYPNVVIDRDLLPSIALAVERDDLSIPAGLQDRVVQVFGGVVEMDFDPSITSIVDGYEVGQYVEINPALLNHLFVAFKLDGGEPTEVVHNNLRHRFEAKERAVCDAMRELVKIVDDGKQAIEAGDQLALADLINRNFDIRSSICPLRSDHVQMVHAARREGASAKYCGSGGAIVGTYPDEHIFRKLSSSLEQLGCRVFKPTITETP